MNRGKQIVAVLAGLMLTRAEGIAQAVQAVTGTLRDATTPAISLSVEQLAQIRQFLDGALVLIVEQIDRVESGIAGANTSVEQKVALRRERIALETAFSHFNNARRSSNPTEIGNQVAAALRALEEFPRAQSLVTSAQNVVTLSGPPLPSGASTLVSDIAFVVGAGTNVFRPSETSLSIGTNLLGAAAGTLLQAVGLPQDFTSYIKDNIVIGFDAPTSKGEKPLSILSMGLGSATFRRGTSTFTVWPVLAVEERDSSSSFLPGEVRALGTSKPWTQLVFGLGFLKGTKSEAQTNLGTGVAVPVFSLGVGLPYFYPGDILDGLLAPFTARRGNFVRAGDLRLTFGVALPLLRLRPAPAQTEKN